MRLKKHKVFKALGNERRLKIIEALLREGSLSLEALSKRIRLSYRSTSKHLLLLEGVGFLERVVKNRNVFYTLSAQIKNKLKALIHLAGETV